MFLGDMIPTFSTSSYGWLPFRSHKKKFIKKIDPLPWILSTWNGQTIQKDDLYTMKMITLLGGATQVALLFILDSKSNLPLPYPIQNIRFWILELDRSEFHIMIQTFWQQCI